MDPKTRGIVAYITLIGWIVAIVTNNPKDEVASFHIRQMLGIMCFAMASLFLSWIPLLGLLVSLAAFVLWLIGFIGALSGEQKEVPFLGEYFQKWFKTL